MEEVRWQELGVFRHSSIATFTPLKINFLHKSIGCDLRSGATYTPANTVHKYDYLATNP